MVKCDTVWLKCIKCKFIVDVLGFRCDFQTKFYFVYWLKHQLALSCGHDVMKHIIST